MTRRTFSKFQLCDWLRREFLQIHPRDRAKATRLMVQLGVACKEPHEFHTLFAAAKFDKSPVAPRIDPELWPERPVDRDWNSEDPEEYGVERWNEEPMGKPVDPVLTTLAISDEQADIAVNLLLRRVEAVRPDLAETLRVPLSDPLDSMLADEAARQLNITDREYLSDLFDQAVADALATAPFSSTALPI